MLPEGASVAYAPMLFSTNPFMPLASVGVNLKMPIHNNTMARAYTAIRYPIFDKFFIMLGNGARH